jgi:hypothetical protein
VGAILCRGSLELHVLCPVIVRPVRHCTSGHNCALPTQVAASITEYSLRGHLQAGGERRRDLQPGTAAVALRVIPLLHATYAGPYPPVMGK